MVKKAVDYGGNEVSSANDEPHYKYKGHHEFAEVHRIWCSGQADTHFILPPGLEPQCYTSGIPSSRDRWAEFCRNGKHVDLIANAYTIAIEYCCENETIGWLTKVQMGLSNEGDDRGFARLSKDGVLRVALSSGFAHSGDVPRAARPVFFAPVGRS